MNLEILTKVKTANLEEHLKVVKQDVNIASIELSKILELTKLAKDTLSKYDKDILEKTNKYVYVVGETQRELRKVEVAKENLSRQSIELDKKKEKVDGELEEKRLLIIDLENKLNQNRVYFKDTIKEYELRVKLLIDNISKLEKRQLELSTNNNVSEKELNELNNEISKKKEEKEILEIEQNRFVVNSTKEKETILKDLETEREKIANPMKLLTQTNFEVSRKERNVKILINRFRREYTKLFPTKTCPI